MNIVKKKSITSKDVLVKDEKAPSSNYFKKYSSISSKYSSTKYTTA